MFSDPDEATGQPLVLVITSRDDDDSPIYITAHEPGTEPVTVVYGLDHDKNDIKAIVLIMALLELVQRRINESRLDVLPDDMKEAVASIATGRR